VTPIGRRALAEFVGTAFLVAAVIGSGIAAQRLSPGDTGLQLLENAIATGAVLLALISVLQPVSAAFNPLVTVVDRACGAIDTRAAGALIGAQFAGGFTGAVAANVMFGHAAVELSTKHRGGSGVLLAEAIATLGLLLMIFGLVRAGRSDKVAFTVAGYITAAYWFTSSTSFANPAVTVARMFSDSFAGIAPISVPGFLLMQVAGMAVAFVLVRILYPSDQKVTVS
jgi:arsenate reductase